MSALEEPASGRSTWSPTAVVTLDASASSSSSVILLKRLYDKKTFVYSIKHETVSPKISGDQRVNMEEIYMITVVPSGPVLRHPTVLQSSTTIVNSRFM